MASNLILICSVIFLMTAVVRVDIARSDAYRSAPWGSLWAISYTVYIAIPFGLRKLANYTSIANSDKLLSDLILTRQAVSLSVFAIGFTLAYVLYALRDRAFKASLMFPEASLLRAGGIKKKKDIKRDRFNPDWILTLTTGGFVTAGAVLSALTDVSDRYNSGAAGSIAAKIVATLAINGFMSSCFMFMAGLKTGGLAEVRRHSMKAARTNRYLCYLVLALEISILLAYIVKTGSRSIMLMAIMSLIAGYIWRGDFRQQLVSARLITVILITSLMALPLAETIRIARSSSDYYKFNPMHAARLISSSFKTKISLTEFAVKNRRDELSDSAYIIEKGYNRLLTKREPGQMHIEVAESNQRTEKEQSKTSAPARIDLIKDIFSTISLKGTSIFFYSKEDNKKRAIMLGLDPKGIASGEQINLPADLYSKGGIGFCLLGGFAMGLILSGIREITTLTADRLTLEAGVYVKSLPLGFLAGNLSLPLPAQSWLILVQLPKMLCACIVLGTIARAIRSKLRR